jgi:hypothetical protein
LFFVWRSFYGMRITVLPEAAQPVKSRKTSKATT